MTDTERYMYDNDNGGKGPLRIIIGNRAWMWVGFISKPEGEDDYLITDAVILRNWGTEAIGLGALKNGPLSGTVIDPCGDVVIHPIHVIGQVKLNNNPTTSKWFAAIDAKKIK